MSYLIRDFPYHTEHFARRADDGPNERTTRVPVLLQLRLPHLPAGCSMALTAATQTNSSVRISNDLVVYPMGECELDGCSERRPQATYQDDMFLHSIAYVSTPIQRLSTGVETRRVFLFFVKQDSFAQGPSRKWSRRAMQLFVP